MTKVAPWQVWHADLNPVEGHEQGDSRPVLVVSSSFHLRLTASALVTVLPLTTVERPGLLHRVAVRTRDGTSYAITEQVRTISRRRLRGEPIARLQPGEIASVREVFAQMLDV
jgi:mRNA interferase MazF